MSLVALLLLLLVLGFFFGGLGLHWLWIIAVVLLVLFIIGFFIGEAPAAGGRRRYYGRW